MLQKRLTSSFVLLAALLWSSTAFAQTWNDTFEAEAVHSHMSQDGHQFLVVAAGDGGESVKEAAKSLEAALRSGPASLVMNDEALGSVEGLDDDAIAEKAAALPVDRVAIVRVFAGATETDETVVVMVRDKEGETLWALSGTRGVAVEAPAGTTSAVVDSSVAESASSAVRESGEENMAAQEEYNKMFIWAPVNKYGVLLSSRSMYQGKYKKVLRPSQFYHEVGRPDLAQELASNQAQRTAGFLISGVGYLGLIGSVPWWFFEGAVSFSDNRNAHYIGPALLSGASIAAVIVGIVIMPNQIQPITQSEALELADQYNQRLKKDLGLDGDHSAIFDDDAPNAMKVSYGLSPTWEGVSGVIRVDF